MERKIILASHGHFASGILSSLKLICGDQKNIEVLDCFTTPDFDLSKEVKNIMKNKSSTELLVVTDIFGGSVNNEFLQYIHTSDYYLIAGMNLPFLVEVVTQINITKSLEKLVFEALENSKNSIQCCNVTFNEKIIEEEF